MHTDYTIKKATVADIPVINKLASAIWEPTYKQILSKEQIDYMFNIIYTPAALQKQMQEGQTFLLLCKSEKPIGFAAYSIKSDADAIYKLNKIYLLPEYQGKGAGKYLLKLVEAEVKSLGGNTLDLNVNIHNKAKFFYEHNGYAVHQEEDIPIGPFWMNDYVMRKVL